jgi:ABC-type transporter Mla maintaining outer membrane lipid asymmetry ATPase subunit MlaF
MNQGQTPAIEFRNVSISFDDMKALQNVSFTLPRGDMLCITGDSDSGKSVLLRLALGTFVGLEKDQEKQAEDLRINRYRTRSRVSRSMAIGAGWKWRAS